MVQILVGIGILCYIIFILLAFSLYYSLMKGIFIRIEELDEEERKRKEKL